MMKIATIFKDYTINATYSDNAWHGTVTRGKLSSEFIWSKEAMGVVMLVAASGGGLYNPLSGLNFQLGVGNNVLWSTINRKYE